MLLCPLCGDCPESPGLCRCRALGVEAPFRSVPWSLVVYLYGPDGTDLLLYAYGYPDGEVIPGWVDENGLGREPRPEEIPDLVARVSAAHVSRVMDS